jgi:hypothetical protein
MQIRKTIFIKWIKDIENTSYAIVPRINVRMLKKIEQLKFKVYLSTRNVFFVQLEYQETIKKMFIAL